MNCKTVPVGAKGKLNSWNGCAVVAIGGTAKCCQMYGWCKCIQSQRMLMTCMGFVWTGWPPSLHGPALLLVPTVFPPVGLPYPSEAHCTIPTFALVFGGNKKKKTKHEKGVDAFYTTACLRVEVRLALSHLLVGSFLCRSLLLFRSRATFRLYYSIQTTAAIPT